MVDQAPVWSVVQRALRRPGEWEVVGVVVGEKGAVRGRDWLSRAVPDVLGGEWEVQTRRVGPGLTALQLRAAEREVARRRRSPRRRAG